MALSRTVVFALAAACVSACANAAPPQLPANFVAARPDYFRLVVEPQVQTPPGEANCELRNPENAGWLEGWARDFWINMHDSDFVVGVSVSYAGSFGAVEHQIPIFLFHATDFGRKCEIRVNRLLHRSPLFRADEVDQTFVLTTINTAEKELDTLQLYQSAITLLELTATLSQAPEALTATLSQAAHAAGNLWSSEIQNLGSSVKESVVRYELGAGSETDRELNVPLLSLKSGSGPIRVSADAFLQPIGSALMPHPYAVPDFSQIPAASALNWKIAGLSLPEAIDASTSNKWTAYAAETDPLALNKMCVDVQTGLIARGFSSADAAILAWIMTRSHSHPAAVAAMTHPQCLEDKRTELLRFGVTLAEVPPMEPAAAS